MTPLDRLLYRSPDPETRILFTDGEDPAVIEAASLAAARELVVPMLIGNEDAAKAAAPDVPTDRLMFLDFIDLVEATPIVELARLLVEKGVAHGALFGADVDVVDSARALEHEEPVSASVFLQFSTGAVIVLTAGLSETSAEIAEIHVGEFVGPNVTVRRLGPDDLSAARKQHLTDDLVLCDTPDLDFRICEILRTFGEANAYGPLLFGSIIPAAFLRPDASIEDVLGSLALLTALVGPTDPAIDVSTVEPAASMPSNRS